MCDITTIAAGANCYLLTQNDASVLIDAGAEESAERLLRCCEGKNIKLIVLTHGHADHIANAAFLSKALHVPIAMHRRDVSLAKDNLCREMGSRGLAGAIVRFFSILSMKNAKLSPFVPELLLSEGDSLKEYGIDAGIVELPGHTAGSIGILVEGQCFIVGDALMNMFNPGPSLLFEDHNEMLNSAQRITEAGPLKIYFGHGKPVDNRKWVR